MVTNNPPKGKQNFDSLADWDDVLVYDFHEYHLEDYLGMVVFYGLFFVAVPLAIWYFAGWSAIRFYLPLVDLIANLLASTIPAFRRVHDHRTDNFFTYTSTLIINLVALTGVAWIGIAKAMKTGDKSDGIMASVIMFFMTYLLPIELIPLSVKVYDMITKPKAAVAKSPGLPHKPNMMEALVLYDDKIIAGLVTIVLLVTIEGLLIKYIV